MHKVPHSHIQPASKNAEITRNPMSRVGPQSMRRYGRRDGKHQGKIIILIILLDIYKFYKFLLYIL